jgi:hypothetical protein
MRQRLLDRWASGGRRVENCRAPARGTCSLERELVNPRNSHLTNAGTNASEAIESTQLEPTMDLTRQLISFVGALLILIAYAGHQMGWINARRPAYNLLNAAGSLILFWIALHPFQVGFIVLEGVWTIISLWALARPRPA